MIIKDLKEVNDKDITNSMYYSSNSSSMLINSKSCLQSLLKLANEIIPKKINCNTIDELFVLCNIHKMDYIEEKYKKWLDTEVQPPYNKDFEIINYEDFFQFFKELVYLVIFNRIYKYTNNLLISEEAFNTNLNLVGIYEYIMENSNLWIQDKDNYPNIDATFEKYTFLNFKCFKTETLQEDMKLRINNEIKPARVNEQLQFIKDVIINMVSNHIRNNVKLNILYGTALKANTGYYLFNSSVSLLGIGFHELLTNMISDSTNSKITECPTCHKLYVKHNGTQIYCSKICKGKARKEIDYKYNHSQKGKDRTIKFHQKKTSQFEID